MKTLYLECHMGAAGDMLCAALLELLPEPATFIHRMNELHLPGVAVASFKTEKCGIVGTRFQVKVAGMEELSLDHSMVQPTPSKKAYTLKKRPLNEPIHRRHSSSGHHHSHGTGLEDMYGIIQGLDLSAEVKHHAKAIYALIAEAESKAHGKPVDQIHFHEVGAVDAVVDIVGFCLLVEMLQIDQILASPITTGFGHVRTAHGILPIPAPATAHLLEGVPVQGGRIEGELCTPTGAAIIKHYSASFCHMPSMVIQKTGYGMGKKDFEAVNCVRAILGDMAANGQNESVVELRANIDDMTPEALAFAVEQLLADGARDVYVQPVHMKKNRTGFVIVVLCTENETHLFTTLIFKYTSTLGVRQFPCLRQTLQREETFLDTLYGRVRVKVSKGYGTHKRKIEYEDLASIAREHKLSIEEVLESIYNMK